jgi:hypothetical protein
MALLAGVSRVSVWGNGTSGSTRYGPVTLPLAAPVTVTIYGRPGPRGTALGDGTASVTGELRLALSADQPAEAEACFQRALAVARHQQAKALELRAAMSLSRLWQRQGNEDKAHHLLAEVYGWFTEGFDTADLQEAKVLLDDWS